MAAPQHRLAAFSSLPVAAALAVALATGSTACRLAAVVTKPQIVQPGAPGEASRTINADQATDQTPVRASAPDVAFMQGMIGHHSQAVEMVELLKTRTTREDMRMLGLRIEVSQTDEMGMMRRWLESHGQPLPSEHAHHMPGATLMPGMLTPDEMTRLTDAKGADFDRLFLQGMIKHHEGALTMVQALFASPGAAQESEIFAFASDVDADQRMEIDRMRAMLTALTSPRASGQPTGEEAK